MPTRSLEPSSTFSVRTRATGLLSKVAHDLELRAEGVDADVEMDGTSWTAILRFPVRSLRVVGVLKRGDRVDETTLSAKDRGEIERKLQREVLPFETVTVEASGSSHERAEATIITGKGRCRVTLRLRTRARDDGGLSVKGDGRVSMRALGLSEVKGPMGVFKVKDELELACDVAVAPAADQSG